MCVFSKHSVRDLSSSFQLGELECYTLGQPGLQLNNYLTLGSFNELTYVVCSSVYKCKNLYFVFPPLVIFFHLVYSLFLLQKIEKL